MRPPGPRFPGERPSPGATRPGGCLRRIPLPSPLPPSPSPAADRMPRRGRSHAAPRPIACRAAAARQTARAIKRGVRAGGTAPHQYRDRIFIRKDIILTLAEYGRLNATSLATNCGLNMAKHRGILEDLEEKGIIGSAVEKGKGRDVTYYHVTGKGLEFCSRVLDPYEEMFPRKGRGGRGFNPEGGGGGGGTPE